MHGKVEKILIDPMILNILSPNEHRYPLIEHRIYASLLMIPSGLLDVRHIFFCFWLKDDF